MPIFLCKRGAIVDLVTILFIFILAMIIVDPIGNFPLNDNWSYGKAVKHFVDHGVLLSGQNFLWIG